MTCPRAIPPTGTNSSPRIRPVLGEAEPLPRPSEARDLAVASVLRAVSFAVTVGTLIAVALVADYIIRR